MLLAQLIIKLFLLFLQLFWFISFQFQLLLPQFKLTHDHFNFFFLNSFKFFLKFYQNLHQISCWTINHISFWIYCEKYSKKMLVFWWSSIGKCAYQNCEKCEKFPSRSSLNLTEKYSLVWSLKIDLFKVNLVVNGLKVALNGLKVALTKFLIWKIKYFCYTKKLIWLLIIT